jgi:hypothetical protein
MAAAFGGVELLVGAVAQAEVLHGALVAAEAMGAADFTLRGEARAVSRAGFL